MSKEILANNKDDVALLGACFMTTPKEELWKVLAHVFNLELFKFKGFMGFLLKVLKLFRGNVGIFTFFNILYEKFPKTLYELNAELILHVVKGEDTEDWDSVGGWSQREIDILLEKVKFSLLEGKIDAAV